MRTPYFRILIFKILPQIRQNFNRVKRFLRKKNQKVCFFSAEKPHSASLTKGFWRLETEVTQAMRGSMMGTSVRQQRDMEWLRGEGAEAEPPARQTTQRAAIGEKSPSFGRVSCVRKCAVLPHSKNSLILMFF
ncbi:MAG: hypothetical protein J6J31_03990 [Thermoguttaceae bacterium]|nr:hypothetical protein [Thermoguttaceae bacterium]